MSKSNLNKQEKLKINQLLADLQGKDEAKVAAAIKSLSVHGHVSVIEPLLDVWSKGLSTENELLISNLFHNLKDTSVIEPLIQAFRNPQYADLRRRLLISFWNSKLDYTPYIADFVLFAVEGDFLDTLEALTLIENAETVPLESAVMESQLLLKEYFGQDEAREAQKDALLADLALILKDYDEQDGTEDLFLE